MAGVDDFMQSIRRVGLDIVIVRPVDGGNVQITIPIRALLGMANKAMANKSGRCKRGPVTVTFTPDSPERQFP